MTYVAAKWSRVKLQNATDLWSAIRAQELANCSTRLVDRRVGVRGGARIRVRDHTVWLRYSCGAYSWGTHLPNRVRVDVARGFSVVCARGPLGLFALKRPIVTGCLVAVRQSRREQRTNRSALRAAVAARAPSGAHPQALLEKPMCRPSATLLEIGKRSKGGNKSI